MKALRSTLLLALIPATSAWADRVVVPAPDAGNQRFGGDIVVLPNGNYLVTDPAWSAGAGLDRAGAVYLYSGAGVLLSQLHGSLADDEIGSGGILILPSGDFVIRSPRWDAGPAQDAGAVTWGDADTGFGAAQVSVGADNSLVGSSTDDQVGAQPLVALANGSYVVASGLWDRIGVALDAGAVTWCAADGSTIGPISASNSLIGSQAQDRVGDTTVAGVPSVTALSSGHYVVASSFWDNGAIVDAGAATWGSNDGAVVGPVSTANSLVGTQAADHVGADVLALNNGHYVVQSWLWDGAAQNVGAATWADGFSARSDSVSALNSLVGSQSGDRVGFLAAALSNGHYVVASPLWSNGAAAFAGAVTWRNGNAAHAGIVGAANSLVGTRFGDSIGYFTTLGIDPLGVVPLPSGHYVVASPEWSLSDTAFQTGAVTWADGNGGTVGPVGVDNSLVGSAPGDAIAQYVVTLANGDYAVASPYWSQRRGAVTWGSATTPLIGTLGADNSLVGARTTDFVSASGVYRLPDGGYAVPTPRWSSDAALSLGAVTRAAAGGVVGVVSGDNSFLGAAEGDLAGSGGVLALPNGDLLVRSALASGAGGLTRIPAAATPASFSIGAQNSLTGHSEDRIGSPGLRLQSGGAIVLFTASGTADGEGAITLFAPQDPFRGALPEIDTVRSAVPEGGLGLNFGYLPTNGVLVVGDPAANRVVRLELGRIFRDGFD